jgi:hypothetical protein
MCGACAVHVLCLCRDQGHTKNNLDVRHIHVKITLIGIQFVSYDNSEYKAVHSGSIITMLLNQDKATEREKSLLKCNSDDRLLITKDGKYYFNIA